MKNDFINEKNNKKLIYNNHLLPVFEMHSYYSILFRELIRCIVKTLSHNILLFIFKFWKFIFRN